jgi:hypothetical protein
MTSIYLHRVLEDLPIPSEEGTLLGGVIVVVKGRKARAIAYDDYSNYTAAHRPVLVVYEDGTKEYVATDECEDALP